MNHKPHDYVVSLFRVLEHDDSLTDRSDGGILDTNFKATKSLWLSVYGQEYKVPGGMYRGEPPMAFFNGNWARVNNHGVMNNKEAAVGDTLILPGVTLAHLIGEVGASSVGKFEGSNLTWMSIDAPDAFIPPQSKNPITDMYVFGEGGELR